MGICRVLLHQLEAEPLREAVHLSLGGVVDPRRAEVNLVKPCCVLDTVARFYLH